MASSPSTSSLACEKACREIHEIWDRLGCLGQVLASTTRMERRHIRETYKSLYGEDLIDHLQRSTNTNSSEMCNLLSLWMMEPHERDAVIARDALEGSDMKYEALVEIYIGRKPSRLLLIKQAYHAKFRRHLDKDISCEPPTPQQKILVALVASHNSHYAEVSQHVARCDAKRLYEAGEGKMGAIDESVVLEIMCKRSIPQFKLTLLTYKRIYGHDYKKSLKKDSCGEFEDALRVVVKCLCTPVKYYSKILYTSIKRADRGMNSLERVLVCMGETDKAEILKSFHIKSKMMFEEALFVNIPNEDLRDFLVVLATAPST